jgi:hypothetical protein
MLDGPEEAVKDESNGSEVLSWIEVIFVLVKILS